jgi:hypothetical protein
VRWLLAIMVAATTGCAPHDVTTTPVELVAPSGVRLIRDPCSTGPELLVPIEMAGTLGWFVLDSGSFAHAVYASFAARAKLRVEPLTERIGGGRGIVVPTIARGQFGVPGVGRFESPSILVLDAAVTPLADHDCGVAGVVPPAMLVTDREAVVIDYRARRLSRVAVGEVEPILAAAGRHRFVARGIENPMMKVTIGGHTVHALIDTGACCTSVTTSGPIGTALRTPHMRGGTLERLEGRRRYQIARTTLQLGDATRTIDLHLVEVEDEEPDGDNAAAIGADALRDCVLAFLDDELRGACT